MIYRFEKDMDEFNKNYFLKESENPFIFFLEYAKPEELVKRLDSKKEYSVIPVTCVISNMNYITSAILRKIRHKLCVNDTFEINCHINTYCIAQTKDTVEHELSKRITSMIKIEYDKYHPVWTINLYIVGDITAINIINSRNKIKQKMNMLK